MTKIDKPTGTTLLIYRIPFMTRGGVATALFKETLSRSKSSFLRKKHLAPFTKAYIPHNNIRTISKGYQQKSVFKNQSTSLSPIKTQTPSSFPRQKKNVNKTHRFTFTASTVIIRYQPSNVSPRRCHFSRHGHELRS